MNINNKDSNTPAPTRRAEIVLTFDVPKVEATKEWLDAVVGIIRREVAANLGRSAHVEGKWI